ncbi:MAG: transposase [Xenococcaceae cyanobacterium MO_207.B15]|nr:transposase [Xenococcaceae cyanobacterium MO_207.B15]
MFPNFQSTSTEGKITGIDLGLKDYVTCHNGTDTYSVKHPKWLKLKERNLRHQQKQLSRRKKGSNRRNKARQLVVRVHEHCCNARQDFLHKLSRSITEDSQVVIVEKRESQRNAHQDTVS